MGHEPSISESLKFLISYCRPDLEYVPKSLYPTGGLSVINFNITNWNKIDEKTGILDAFITPQYLEEYEKIINIYLASPRGFCAGVKRAIEIVELALQKYGPPIYVDMR